MIKLFFIKLSIAGACASNIIYNINPGWFSTLYNRLIKVKKISQI